jgi:glyoxylase-like metal-dependent hydrolase (beta-lactamase superfamily II)
MMRITKHEQTMIQLSNLFPANMYLVRENDGFTLIDTGLSGGAKKILAAAEANGAPIRRIVLTHGHADHIGSLDALHALLPDAEVIASERTARFMRGDMRLEADEPQSKLRGGWVTSQTTPTRLLKAGDRVGSLEVVAAPGHSPDHVAYLDTRNGTLFAGDAYSTQAGIHTAGTLRLLFPFTSMATWHKPTALHSAEKLAALKPARLAVGHGKVLTDPVPAMQAAIAEAKRKIEGNGWQPGVA